jgi:hypothetical protein
LGAFGATPRTPRLEYLIRYPKEHTLWIRNFSNIDSYKTMVKLILKTQKDADCESIPAEDLLARAFAVVCKYGIIDSRLLSESLGITETVAETIIGAFLSSGYLSEVEAGNVCGICPLVPYCVRASSAIKVFKATDKLKEMCKSLRTLEHQVEGASRSKSCG